MAKAHTVLMSFHELTSVMIGQEYEILNNLQLDCQWIFIQDYQMQLMLGANSYQHI